jgi:hypothetical protein
LTPYIDAVALSGSRWAASHRPFRWDFFFPSYAFFVFFSVFLLGIVDWLRRGAMKGDAAIQEPLVLDAGMKYFPQYNFLLTPFMLYGVPALYLVLAITGHFAMRKMSTCAAALECCRPSRYTSPFECRARPRDSLRFRLHRACSAAPAVASLGTAGTH